MLIDNLYLLTSIFWSLLFDKLVEIKIKIGSRLYFIDIFDGDCNIILQFLRVTFTALQITSQTFHSIINIIEDIVVFLGIILIITLCFLAVARAFYSKPSIKNDQLPKLKASMSNSYLT